MRHSFFTRIRIDVQILPELIRKLIVHFLVYFNGEVTFNHYIIIFVQAVLFSNLAFFVSKSSLVFIGECRRPTTNTLAKYLFSHLPLQKQILKDLMVLHSLLQKSVCGVDAVARIARKLQVIKEEEMNILLNEWKMYQADEISVSWFKKSGTEEYKRIDDYWKKVMDQKNALVSEIFKVLPKYVKAVLCFAPRNCRLQSAPRNLH